MGPTQVGKRVWLVTFMHYDLGYFDNETCRLEPIENPFAPKLLPMPPEWTCRKMARRTGRLPQQAHPRGRVKTNRSCLLSAA